MSYTFDDANFSEERICPSPKRFKMNNPDTQNNTFLFTSESVGEGHPGKLQKFNSSVNRAFQFRSTML